VIKLETIIIIMTVLPRAAHELIGSLENLPQTQSIKEEMRPEYKRLATKRERMIL
jgi:hypothetical protein